MSKKTKAITEADPLAEATAGKYYWNSPGMDDLEKGWEEFTLGTRVEIRTNNGVWRKGTVVETIDENDRGISVKCDEKWHDNLKFYEGRGATVMVYMNTRRGILSRIRKIDEPRRKVIISHRKPAKLKGNRAKLLKIAKIAVKFSGGRLRLAYNEEDESKKFVGNAARFLKLDGKRFGRDIELYGFMGDDIAGWQQVLVMFLKEVILPLRQVLPKSYTKASEALRLFGKSIYPEDLYKQWCQLF